MRDQIGSPSSVAEGFVGGPFHRLSDSDMLRCIRNGSEMVREDLSKLCTFTMKGCCECLVAIYLGYVR